MRRISGTAASLAIAVALAGAGCATLGDAAVWADGEVRDLETRKPIAGAVVSIGAPSASVYADPLDLDQTNAAGRFSVFRAAARGQRSALLVVRAEGFKPAEYEVPVLQSTTLIARLAPEGSAQASRIEQMPVAPDGSDGHSDSDSD